MNAAHTAREAALAAAEAAADDDPRPAPAPGDTLPEAGPEAAQDAGRDGPSPAPAPRKGARRGGGDPVKGLLHRHRGLCEGAVDPLEIAAGLEAHGVTDRTAARFRHRDVFSLAEEMFARAGDVEPEARARAAEPTRVSARTWVLCAAPGIVCGLAVAGIAFTRDGARLGVAAVGVLATAVALVLALRAGPLRTRTRRTAPAAGLWVLWLIAYTVCGQGLVAEIAGGRPDGPPTADPLPLVPLALALVPAAWCAQLFAVRARRRAETARGLADFAAGTRPLLFAVVLLHTAALGVLAAVTGLLAPGTSGLGAAAALGALLFLARLLVVHGFPESASAALAAACAVEAAVPALLLSGRLPGLDPVARPLEHLVVSWGPAVVPVAACTAAALALLVHASTVLVRASAHTR